MRISDWSSDVCSSDLHGARRDESRAPTKPRTPFALSLSKGRSFFGKKRTGLRQAQPERTRGKREQALTQNFLFLRRCRSVDVGDGRVGQLLHLGLVALALILADFLLVLAGLGIVH